jgi:SOS-response transcriptional repressor LexA
MDALTDRQAEVLKAIYEFTLEHGFAPTFRELGDVIGVGSTNAVAELVAALSSKGAVCKQSGRTRTMVLTRAGLSSVNGLRKAWKEREARRIETLLATPLASEDFKEGVRRSVLLLRCGGVATDLDGEALR